MSVVNALNPAGKTPLTEAVKQAAEVLDYKTEKGVVVLVTDGEETCGGAPCELGKFLEANGRALTVHVIGYQLTGFSWTGAESILDVKCLAEETGGLYITAKNRDDLVKAFEKTLGCPMMSAVARLVTLSSSFAPSTPSPRREMRFKLLHAIELRGFSRRDESGRVECPHARQKEFLGRCCAADRIGRGAWAALRPSFPLCFCRCGFVSGLGFRRRRGNFLCAAAARFAWK